MRKILIVGAGQSGLYLAHGLLSHGYEVTLITSQSSTDLRESQPALTQFSLPTALGRERELRLDFWSGQAPPITGATVRLYPPSTAPLTVAGAFPGSAVAVDRRVKMADWLEYFEDRGGKVIIHGITVSDLDYFATMFDLILIAVGHGELGALFDPDPQRFGGAQPRMIAHALLDNVEPAKEPDQGGEYAEVGSAPHARVFLAPILSFGGCCHALFIVEGQEGQISNWPARMEPTQRWRQMRHLLSEHTPELYARVNNATLVEGASATLHHIRPQVRHPVAHLPGGGHVLGVADVVISTDPLAGQGWTTSTLSAAAYLARILHHGDAPFTPEWMEATFEVFWSGTHNPHFDYAGVGEAAATLSDALDRMWDAEAPAHLGEVIAAAAQHPEVAHRFIAGLDDPRDYQSWLYEEQTARAYLHQVTHRRG